MIECFAEQKFSSCFQDRVPKLRSAWKIDASNSQPINWSLHSHKDVIEIFLVREGAGVYIIDEKRYPIQKGDLVIVNSGTLHDETAACSQQMNRYGVSFSDVQLNGFRPNALIHDRLCPIIPTNEYFEQIETLIEQIYIQLTAGGQTFAEATQYLGRALLVVIYQIVQKANAKQDEPRKTNAEMLTARIKQYIDTRYDETLTLETISEALHVNMYYMAHVFKDTTGYSLMQYITRRRLGEAQRLLITTDYSITQIGNMVGYGNPSHFNTVFTKYIGVAPGKFRHSYRSKQTN